MNGKKNSAEASVEEIYGLIESHLTSLAEKEALERLEIIDRAHAKARATTAGGVPVDRGTTHGN